MDRLPDEIILHIIPYLEPQDLALFQVLSHRFLSLGRDDEEWKRRCFEHSRYESNRQRQLLLAAQEPTLAALRRVMNTSALIGTTQGVLNTNGTSEIDSTVERSALKHTSGSSTRAMANWEPSYPAENTNYYQEYIQRHAPITLNWLQNIQDTPRGPMPSCESIGVGVLEFGDTKVADKVIAPLDDGTIGVWDVNPDSTRRGHIITRSAKDTLFENKPALATNTTTIINDTGAVDNVSIDSSQKKAYVAVAEKLNELDLNTLQIIRQQSFPFPITALSAANANIPLTIGTNMTLHLYDPRAPEHNDYTIHKTQCELIGGSIPVPDLYPFSKFNSKRPASLPQPGPLSIVHLPNGTNMPTLADPIWVAGRFTSLLTYDRRFWPRISSTLFSGARLSSLTYLPFPYVPRSMRADGASLHVLQAAKAQVGSTLVAAGEYNGKGSLELYATPRMGNTASDTQEYRNRQTASKSRLLSVTAHGTRLVFSDGDGNLKWVERDGSTLVRSFNINDYKSRYFPPDGASRLQPRSQLFGHGSESNDDQRSEDIVQKIIAMNPQNHKLSAERNDLLIWTGEGKLGLIGFGYEHFMINGDELEQEEAIKDKGEEERKYAVRMREALERHADETRFVRGLGLGLGF